jgi:hypothetical protein
VQVEPGIDVAEVVAGELSDARQSVAQRASMDVEGVGAFDIVSAAFQISAESQDQFGVLALVVVQE